MDFYIWLTHEDQDFRSKTYSLTFFDNKDASNQITPEEIGAVNAILAEVDEAMTEMETIDIDAEKVNTTTTVTLTDRNGQTKTVNIYDGEQGPAGQDGYTPQRGIDYWTNQDQQAIESDINNDLKTYFNQPFATFGINNNGHLIMEVKEFGNTN